MSPRRPTRPFTGAVLVSTLITGLSLPGLAHAMRGPVAAAVDTFRVDPSHAHVGFAVRHLAIATVRGVFREVSGALAFDRDDPSRSTVRVRIATASVNTHNERRDTDLRDNFLRVAEHPEITFESSRLRRDGDEWLAIGTLTIAGVGREVTMRVRQEGPIAAPGGIERIGIAGTLVVDRRDYGLTLSRVAETGALVVGNEVRIEVDVEFGRRVPGAS